jgi:protein-S-isoprenylcysteine O-methyltransferase Ste14
MLFARALLSFLLLPGVVAGLVPLIILTDDLDAGSGWFWPGLGLQVSGLAILLWCVRDFYVSGKGTLAPWDPPKSLVRVGLYRWIRNPMYVGVLLWVGGWTVLSGSVRLGVYWIILVVAFHLRVVLFEEPWLARTFPAEWSPYRAAVPRWLPRFSTRTRAARRDRRR